jgi:AraC family transcriptional regulator
MAALSSTAASLTATETHNIVLADGSRVVSTSDGLGWTNIHASLTSERRWSGALAPIDHFCFAYCLRQAARIERRIAGEAAVTTLALRPRQLGILPTRVASAFRLTGSADIMMVYLRGSLVEQAAQEIFDLAGPRVDLRPRVGFSDPLLEQIAMEIVAALDRRDSTSDPRYIDQLARTAALQLFRHHGEPRPTERATTGPARSSHANLGATIARVRSYITDNLDHDLSLPRLAQLAGLGSVKFVETFSAIAQETPHQYVIKRRIERASQLLISTNLPIAEIALRTGFSSQSHFSDVFRRSTGATPRAFRSAGSADQT